MPIHRILTFLVLSAALAIAQENPVPKPLPPAGTAGPTTLSQEQIRELIRQCAENDLANNKKQRDYTYTEQQQVRRIDGKGQVKSTETETYDVMEIYGEPVQKLIAKNDKPLSAKEAKKEDDKIQKLIDRREKESESDRKKRLAQEEKDREDELQFVREAADAFNFTFVGLEKLEGRDTYVIDAEPKPGYKPVHKDAKILTKVRGRIWVDKADTQMAKLDVQFIDTVSFGLFLARVHKGSRLIVENTRVNNEVWLPQHVAVTADVRLALLKNFDFDVDVTNRDYKKFRTDTKIIPIGQMQQTGSGAQH
ncbi:MAG TPA: hypothetical protein VKV05_09975 [Terriglobales bacterium]|nr:hypothetical protein [Terriglobales bacterium]